ncbi:hypothetical protein F5Y05DRAFT_375621 [Hypoxylon sp. FL0543]|nr:hypothetical protein F5Y05DRAFT_375621 [Hypoxylon sp. FL0543]
MRAFLRIASHCPARKVSPQSIHPRELTSGISTHTMPSIDDIPVTLPEGLSGDKLREFPPFKNWHATLKRSLALQHTNSTHPFHKDPYSLRSVTVQSFDLFGRPPHQRLAFLKLTAEVANASGERLPGSIFLRGPSVAMLVMLLPDDLPAGKEGDERYAVLTVQARIPAGSLEFVELPAGMVDDGSFSGTAANEIREELGLEIPASELRNLSEMAATATIDAGSKGNGGRDEGLPAAMYPSAGGCDEFIPIFMYEKRVPRETLDEWTGKLTGLRDHGEKITLKLVKMKDLWKEGGRDAKCLAALALWEGLRRENKL